jgi:hypothetical protein
VWVAVGDLNGGKVGGREYTARDCYTQALEAQEATNDLSGVAEAYVWEKLGKAGGGTVAGGDFRESQYCYEVAVELAMEHVDTCPDARKLTAFLWLTLGRMAEDNADCVEVDGDKYCARGCLEQALEVEFPPEEARNAEVTLATAWYRLSLMDGGVYTTEEVSSEHCGRRHGRF